MFGECICRLWLGHQLDPQLGYTVIWRLPHVRRKWSHFPEHLISLPLGSSRFYPLMIYTLHNWSVLGLCLRIHDSDTRWTQSAYWRATVNPIPKGTLLFFVVYISHCDEIFISQYRSTHVTDVITSSPSWQNVQFLTIWGALGALQWSNWAYLISSYRSTHIYVHVKTEVIWQQLFTFKFKILTKYYSFHIGGGGGGGPGGPYVKPKVTHLLWNYDLMTVQICISREQNNYQFFM